MPQSRSPGNRVSFLAAVVPMAREKFKTHSSFISRVDRPPLSFDPRKETMIVWSPVTDYLTGRYDLEVLTILSQLTTCTHACSNRTNAYLQDKPVMLAWMPHNLNPASQRFIK